MMGRWLERAAELARDIRDTGDETHQNRAIGPFVSNVLAPTLCNGLRGLRSMPVPQMKRPDLWPEIVQDAVRLASDGWAQQALGLGWTSLDLWGVSPAAGGTADLEGLAVWLAGRRIVLLDSNSCLAVASHGSRVAFTRRRSNGGAVHLWELGGGHG